METTRTVARKIQIAKRANRLARQAKDWEAAMALKCELSELRHMYRLLKWESEVC